MDAQPAGLGRQRTPKRTPAPVEKRPGRCRTCLLLVGPRGAGRECQRLRPTLFSGREDNKVASQFTTVAVIHNTTRFCMQYQNRPLERGKKNKNEKALFCCPSRCSREKPAGCTMLSVCSAWAWPKPPCPRAPLAAAPGKRGSGAPCDISPSSDFCGELLAPSWAARSPTSSSGFRQEKNYHPVLP